MTGDPRPLFPLPTPVVGSVSPPRVISCPLPLDIIASQATGVKLCDRAGGSPPIRSSRQSKVFRKFGSLSSEICRKPLGFEFRNRIPLFTVVWNPQHSKTESRPPHRIKVRDPSFPFFDGEVGAYTEGTWGSPNCWCVVRVSSHVFGRTVSDMSHGPHPLSPPDIKSRGVDDDAFTPLAFRATGDVCFSGTLFTSSAKHFVSI